MSIIAYELSVKLVSGDDVGARMYWIVLLWKIRLSALDIFRDKWVWVANHIKSKFIMFLYVSTFPSLQKIIFCTRSRRSSLCPIFYIPVHNIISRLPFEE